MKERVFYAREQSEFLIREGASIVELSNSPDDQDVSIARARVPPGVATSTHRLRDVDERYVILAGIGRVTVGELPPADVSSGDVVRIPRNTSQAILNTGDSDLVFLCICTPRFTPGCYEEVHHD